MKNIDTKDAISAEEIMVRFKSLMLRTMTTYDEDVRGTYAEVKETLEKGEQK